MVHAWSMKVKVVIRAIGENLFAFQFFHWRDKDRVMAGRPWCFEQNLLLLNDITGNKQPNKVVLTHSPFWVRIENLPFNCRSNGYVKAIAAKLGNLMEIEEDLLGIEKDRRVRVMMDVNKPLHQSQNVVNREDMTVKIKLKYERLPFFCFMCGIIGHSERDCTVLSEEQQKRGPTWGMGLKASPRKGHMNNVEGLKEINATKKALFVTKPYA
ncbi:uncharacterized protein [Spinacia oleracea]|uniref:CCHC-type domain-containing protein n=1 Tax=Spinacia oleracea TaxID=3562 RepID=A0A9R0I1H5_SPIOL|nr:uncharacterized protein LOC110780586 [Spinacia oleracea]